MSFVAAFVAILVASSPLVVVGLVIAYSLAQKRKRDESWQRLALHFGFVRLARGAEGVHQGVSISAFEENRGSSKHPNYYLVVRARIEPELDLGLRVRREGFAGGFLEWLGMEPPDLVMGDAPFDQAFRVSGWEPERVRALLTPELRDQLRVAPSGCEPVLQDGSVSLEQRGFVDERFVTWAVPTLVWFTAAVRRAADHVPPSAGLGGLAAAYARLGSDLGLHVLRTPLGMAGSLSGVRVWVLARRHSAQGVSTSLVAQLPSPLSLGLTIVPRRGGALAWFQGSDIEVGQPAFDAAFDVRANDVYAARALLQPAVVASVERLAHRGRLAIDDASVRLDVAGPIDPRDLVPLLRGLCALAHTLSGATAT